MTEDLELLQVVPPSDKGGQNMEAKGKREPWKGARNPGGPEAGDTAALSTKCCPQMGLLQLASVRSIFSPN